MKLKLIFKSAVFMCFFISVFNPFSLLEAGSRVDRSEALQVGKILPNAILKRFGQSDIELKDLQGKVKIVSVVPQLNTPVCDEQTHRLSESNGGLDKQVDIITISTNTAQGQYDFAQKANIKNLTFLSDNPDFDFGKNTGLLIEGMGMLRRTVLIADEKNIIRYVDFVRGGGLPNIKKALKAARQVLLDVS